MGLSSLNSIIIIGTCQGTDGAGQLEHVCWTRGTRRSWKVRRGLWGPLASEKSWPSGPVEIMEIKPWKSLDTMRKGHYIL